MKTIALTTSLLFVLHTIEEVFFQIWRTDPISSFLAKTLNVFPAVIYWFGQIILYTLLYIAFFSSKVNIKISQFMRIIVGLLLILEFSHALWTYSLGVYTPGLYTGTLLGLLGLYFWSRMYKNNLLKTI